MSSRRHAFTLIELLVVIAIIAILAAILFPVFAKAREKARQASCQSNLKQLGIAVQQYVQDYDEMTPPLYNGPADYTLPNGTARTNSAVLWPTLLYPYVKSIAVYNCPSDSYRWTGGYSGTMSYGINTYNDQQTLAWFEYPAENMFLAEASGGDAYALDGDAGEMEDGARHNEGLNNVFLDSHVKWMRYSAIPQRSASSRYWNGAYAGTSP